MSAALLIGGNGQVGRELVTRLAAAGFAVTAPARADLDVTDGDAVRRAVDAGEPAVVINASAYTAVDKAESEPELAFAINRDGPASLALACASAAVPLIHISTDYVYDGSKPDPYVETDAVAPLGVYGASKLAGERAVAAALSQHLILRTAWVYGAQGNNFVKTMLRLGGERDSLRVVADQIGTPTEAGHLADAIVALAGKAERGEIAGDGWGVFHCAGRGETSWHGLAQEVLTLAAPKLGRRVSVEPISTAEYPTPARRPANSRLDCSRLAAVHGLALPDWTAGVRSVLIELGVVSAQEAREA